MTVVNEDSVRESVVDVDVHAAPTSIRDLEPYLSRYWIEYFADAETDLRPSVGNAYPPNAATTGEPLASSVAALRSDYLDVRRPSSAILNCVSSFATNRNPYCEAALTRAINDWMRHEMVDDDDSLRASIVVPSMDVKAAAAEIDRVGSDRKFVQVLLPVRGHDARYGNVRFREIFEAADRHGLVVGVHAWGRRASAPVPAGITNTYIDDYLLNSQVLVQEQLVSMIAEGLFDQFPDLHVSLLECGFSWLPALLMRFHKDWKSVWREVPWMQHEPSHYVYQNIRASTEPAQLPNDLEQVRRILDQIRPADFLMYASDFPHDHGTGGNRLLKVLNESEKASIMRENALAFYRLSQ